MSKERSKKNAAQRKAPRQILFIDCKKERLRLRLEIWRNYLE